MVAMLWAPQTPRPLPDSPAVNGVNLLEILKVGAKASGLVNLHQDSRFAKALLGHSKNYFAAVGRGVAPAEASGNWY